jgi:hypothetical protein
MMNMQSRPGLWFTMMIMPTIQQMSDNGWNSLPYLLPVGPAKRKNG